MKRYSESIIQHSEMLKIPFMVFVRNTEGYTKVKNEIDGMRNTDFMKNRQVTV